MPTPRPIIVARVGAIEGTVTTCPRSTISDSPAARPKTAETIGSPIAASVPKVNARMIIAAIRPTTSLLSVAGSESSLPTEPPTATCSPALAAGFPASRTLSAISCVSSSPLTSSRTGMNAVVLSLLICAAPRWLNGSTAATTCGSFFTRSKDAWIACFAWASVTLPVRARKTSGLLPFCCGGKREASRSDAAWLSVPGRLRLLLVLLPMLCERPISAASRTIQQPRTTHFRRAASKPSR
jgi:hypothetical protein